MRERSLVSVYLKSFVWGVFRCCWGLGWNLMELLVMSFILFVVLGGEGVGSFFRRGFS